MTEEIRALIFIFAIVTGPIYLFLRFSSSQNLKKETKGWIIVWCCTTVLAFLSPNFWIYAAFLFVGLNYYAGPNPIQRICLFFVLLPSLPAATIAIPGFGLINYLFSIGHHHVLILSLLVPLILKKSNGITINRSVNFMLLLYFALLFIVFLRDQTITEVLRNSTVLVITMLIPFFAISKTVKTLEDFKKIMFAILFGILVQATIGIAETLKSWHLYNGVVLSLGVDWGFGGYLGRNNLLRASGALGHPIALGYICVIGLAMIMQFYDKKKRSAVKLYWLFVAILTGGLVATLSRGPWVGAALAILAYILSGQKALNKLVKLGMAGLVALVILSATPTGQSFIDLIPFVSSDEESHAASTISYRQRLMEQSWIVIKRNPIFGTADFLDTPEMESMRQGEGIIDIVNTYLSVALETGLVGLSIFLSIFLIPLARLYKMLPKLKGNIELNDWLIKNRVLMAMIVGVMFTIFTASSIGVIPIYYWSMLGLACAFVKAARTELLKQIMMKNNEQMPLKHTPATHHQTY